MKRLLLVLSVACVAGGLLAPPAVHAEPAYCEPGSSVTEPVETARKGDAVDPTLESQSCYVELTCPAGDVISCSNANNDCSSGNYYVECGGNRTYCPPCTAETECKYGKPPVWCSSQVGDCHVDYLFGVYCDGVYYSCSDTPPQ